MVLVTTLLTLGLLHCMTKNSFAFPLLHLMQVYNNIERIPQHSQVNGGFVMSPAQQLQNQIAQLLQPYQILSNYLMFGNHLMQPRMAPTQQISQTYPIFGSLLPMSVGAPNTQMLPVVFSQVGQQGLLSGSDSEEGILTGVLMVPVDTGLHGNVITLHQAGVSIIGPDSGILMGQSELNPVGQQGITIPNKTNEREFPSVAHHEPGIDGVSGVSIINPTHSPPIGLQRTPSYADPTVPSEMARGDMTGSQSPITENWIFCDSYIPDHQEFQGLTRGDGHLPGFVPEYVLIEKNIE